MEHLNRLFHGKYLLARPYSMLNLDESGGDLLNVHNLIGHF